MDTGSESEAYGHEAPGGATEGKGPDPVDQRKPAPPARGLRASGLLRFHRAPGVQPGAGIPTWYRPMWYSHSARAAFTARLSPRPQPSTGLRCGRPPLFSGEISISSADSGGLGGAACAPCRPARASAGCSASMCSSGPTAQGAAAKGSVDSAGGRRPKPYPGHDPVQVAGELNPTQVITSAPCSTLSHQTNVRGYSAAHNPAVPAAPA